MSFDNSRLTFDPWKSYSGVVMEQGRVQTDADWNEWLSELSRRTRAETLDIMGHAAYPVTTPNAFKIDADNSSGTNSLRIGVGRMYVDGILAENHGDRRRAEWDPALAELSNTPQPQPSTPQPLDTSNSIEFQHQPFNPNAAVPAGPGSYIAYLDVYQRPVNFVQDTSLVDVAIGLDTTGRIQSAWRVGLLPLPAVTIPGSVTGTINPGDTVTQSSSSATGVVVAVVTVGSNALLLLTQQSGTPDNSDAWTNSSSASFTPTALPAATNSYIPGSVTSSTGFTSGESIVQQGTGATATLAGSVASAGPLVVGAVSGNANGSSIWVGQSSGAQFTPAALPAPICNSINGTASGRLIPGEQVIQDGTTASTTVIGATPANGPMLVGLISGSPDDQSNWVGQTSNATFTPGALPVAGSFGCSSGDSTLPWPASSGTLTVQPVTVPNTGPCCLTSGGSYTGPENQLYRIEIHNPGSAGGSGATIKWTRENASVQTSVTGIGSKANSQGNPASSLAVESLGRDQVLGFNAGDWIEITDETHDDACVPGELYKIDRVDAPSSSIVLTTQLNDSFSTATLGNNKYTRIIRWDQSGQIYKVTGGKQVAYYNLDTLDSSGKPQGCGGIPLPSDGSPIVLESGIAIEIGTAMATGSFLPMDYWVFTARSADGSIEELKNAPPNGVAHHYTNLSTVTFPETGNAGATDCRTAWPPKCEGDCGSGCCSVTVGDNQNSFGQFTSIQKAIDTVKDGGEVCILAGDYYENVFIEKRRNIRITGCRFETRVWSQSLNPAQNAQAATGATWIDVPAVFSIAECVGIELNSFSIVADDGQIGVLIDHAAISQSNNQSVDRLRMLATISNESIKIEEMNIEATTMPAIVAMNVGGFVATDNNITMLDIISKYPAVYMTGTGLIFSRNEVKVRENFFIARGTESELSAPKPTEQATASSKLATEKKSSKKLSGEKSAVAGNTKSQSADPSAFSNASITAIGGVQVGGPSHDVWIEDNEIEGSARNGITLGNLIFLDSDGNDLGLYVGVMIDIDSECSQGGSGSVPGSSGSGPRAYPLGVGGLIRDLHILRNKIASVGMCGIGPVGFFNLNEKAEIVSLVNVLIAENILVNTLARAVLMAKADATAFGYGVICLPDVENLIVRDNIIGNYGVKPGAEVCGIYVHNGQGIEIGSNKIQEQRDLSSEVTSWTTYTGIRAGIYINAVTPPALDISEGSVYSRQIFTAAGNLAGDQMTATPPLYAPGFPALRVTGNDVRVAYGLALKVTGSGPFSILGNHFSTGGTTAVETKLDQATNLNNQASDTVATDAGPLTVQIENLGLALELAQLISLAAMWSQSETWTNMRGANSGAGNGTVLFSNNTVQLMVQLSRLRGRSSVEISTRDHVMCSNNEMWIYGPARCAMVDTILLGVSVQAVSNRLQESLQSVLASGYFFGFVNITSLNIATHELAPALTSPTWMQAGNIPPIV